MLSQWVDGIDHVILGVEPLDSASQTFQSLGFTLSPVGDHAGYGSHNRCVVLPDHYLELFSFYDRTRFPQHPMIPLADRLGEHVLGLVYATGDAQAVHDALKAKGHEPPHPVFRQTRHMAGEDGQAFEGDVAIGHLPLALQPSVFSFVCQHFHRQTMWRAEWMRHANRINGLRDVRLFTDTAPAHQQARTAFTTLFGASARALDEDRFAVELGRDRIVVEDYASAIQAFKPGTFPARPPMPYVGLVTLTSPDLAATRAAIDAHGPIVDSYDDRLVVPARHAHGTVLQIVAA